MISVKEALEIHAILIEEFGGTTGLRDVALLESAINRPYQTFDGKALYSSPVEKAAALLESIVQIIRSLMETNEQVMYLHD